MPKSGVVRIDNNVKERAEIVLKEIGMSVSTAIEVFLIQVARSKRIPFDIKIDYIPNQETVNVIKDVEQNNNIAGNFDNVEQLMKNINAQN